MQEKFEFPVNNFPYFRSVRPPNATTNFKYLPIREDSSVVRHERFDRELALVVQSVMREAAISQSKFKDFYAMRRLREFVRLSTHNKL